MKKKYILGVLIIALCLIIVMVLCFKLSKHNNKENTNENEVTGGWLVNTDIKSLSISKEALKVFDEAAKEYTGMSLEPVALLGSQVVAGTNYMFLCKGTTVTTTPETSLKIVIVYNDLKNNAEITSVNDFDYTKYVNKSIENTSKELSGGWNVKSSSESSVLDDKIQTMFDKATSTFAGMVYRPIAVLGTQIVSGTNYAILCYGSASYENKPEAIYLLTLFEDLEGNPEITSQAYIDISEFNN